MHLYLGDLEFSPDRSAQGFAIGGELYISIGDTFFPQENWYDMAWLDLKRWLPSLISFGKSHTDSCLMVFMDGPYSIRLTRTEHGLIQAVCLRDSIPVIARTEIDFSQFIRSVISCCRKYDRFLFENGKTGQFADEIRFLKSILDT